jgi:hypothetical protein
VLYQLSYTHHRVPDRSRRREQEYPVLASQSVGGVREAATACASSLVGPGGGTKSVLR